jgi:hypothetical protein
MRKFNPFETTGQQAKRHFNYLVYSFVIILTILLITIIKHTS